MMIIDAWLSELCSPEPTTKGAALGNTQRGTLCEDDETTSMLTDRLREDLSSSDDDETSGVSFDLLGGILKVLELEVLPPCKKSRTSTWMRQL
eukprot:6180711-Amphidinium_carterae.2